jgi:hypothetical protein
MKEVAPHDTVDEGKEHKKYIQKLQQRGSRFQKFPVGYEASKYYTSVYTGDDGAEKVSPPSELVADMEHELLIVV